MTDWIQDPTATPLKEWDVPQRRGRQPVDQDAPVGAGDPRGSLEIRKFLPTLHQSFPNEWGIIHSAAGTVREDSRSVPGVPGQLPSQRVRSEAPQAFTGTTWTPGSRRAGLLGGQVGPPA